jgi:hypothetical protein
MQASPRNLIRAGCPLEKTPEEDRAEIPRQIGQYLTEAELLDDNESYLGSKLVSPSTRPDRGTLEAQLPRPGYVSQGQRHRSHAHGARTRDKHFPFRCVAWTQEDKRKKKQKKSQGLFKRPKRSLRRFLAPGRQVPIRPLALPTSQRTPYDDGLDV